MKKHRVWSAHTWCSSLLNTVDRFVFSADGKL